MARLLYTLLIKKNLLLDLVLDSLRNYQIQYRTVIQMLRDNKCRYIETKGKSFYPKKIEHIQRHRNAKVKNAVKTVDGNFRNSFFGYADMIKFANLMK